LSDKKELLKINDVFGAPTRVLDRILTPFGYLPHCDVYTGLIQTMADSTTNSEGGKAPIEDIILAPDQVLILSIRHHFKLHRPHSAGHD
jgi:hypothetical protein